MPGEFGRFLSMADSSVNVGGEFRVEGDMSYSLWHQDLLENGIVAEKARNHLGLTHEQVAILAKLTHVARIDEFKKSVSMYSLYTYFCKYSIDPLRWISLIDVWQTMINAAMANAKGQFLSLVWHFSLSLLSPLSLHLSLSLATPSLSSPLPLPPPPPLSYIHTHTTRTLIVSHAHQTHETNTHNRNPPLFSTHDPPGKGRSALLPSDPQYAHSRM